MNVEACALYCFRGWTLRRRRLRSFPLRKYFYGKIIFVFHVIMQYSVSLFLITAVICFTGMRKNNNVVHD